MSLSNNFTAMKNQFRVDTGVEVTTANMDLFLQYYQAKMADNNFQIMTQLLNLLVERLPKR